MIDFLGRKYICMAVSFVILSLGLVAYVSKGFRYHVDFAGGLCLSISFKNPVDTGDLREKMVLVGLKDAVIQKKGKGNHSFIIQITQESSVDAEGNNIGDSIFQKIKSLFPENEITLDSTDWVGPEVGKDIKANAFISVFLSLLLILLYVMVRSKYNYAIGAVVALAHDMLVVLAVFLILGEQISVHVLAAILTVLGYSINDTIVIFTRIGEILKMRLKKIGIEFMAPGYYGLAHITNDVREIRTPEDFKGLKIRATGPMNADLVRQFGGSAIVMGGGEVYIAMARGTVDGTSCQIGGLYDRKWYEVNKYATINLSSGYSDIPMLANLKWWNTLPKDIQGVLKKIAEDSGEWGFNETVTIENNCLEKLKKTNLKMTVLTPEERERFKKVSEPLTQLWIEKHGTIGKELVESMRR